MSPDCSSHASTLAATRALLASERRMEAEIRLRNYANFSGAQFDQLIDHQHPNEFTKRDFRAISKLSVNVLTSAQAWLTGEGRPEVQSLLEEIPIDRDLWDIGEDEFESILGAGSPTWRLWEILTNLQNGAGRSGRWVTAGKMLHGKRPRLIPLYDEQVIKPTLRVTQRTVWEALWCTVRHSDVRADLTEIKAAVPSARDLSLLRVLDIIAWTTIDGGEK